MIKARLDAFLADRKGGVIIYVALAMPVLVGGMGLGGEAGYRYHNQRLLQHAADFAAHAGAVRKYKGDDKPAIDAAATHVAVSSDYDATLGTIAINIPPASGAFAGDPSAVEVILQETRPRLFSAIFSEEPVIVGARAVAAVTGKGSSGCILALSGSAVGAVTVTGNNTTTLTGCSVAANSTSNSAVSLPNGASVLDVECISTTGGISLNANAQVKTDDCMETGGAPVQDPYYWVAEPNASSFACETFSKKGAVGKPSETITADKIKPHQIPWTSPTGETIGVMNFCDGFDAQGIVNLPPGLYIISDPVKGGAASKMTLNGSLSGTDVTFYFTDSAKLDISSTGALDLKAPESGPYSGLLFFGSRSGPVIEHSIQGNPSSVFQGAIYMPNSAVKFSGNSAASSGCTQVIASTIHLTGNSTVTADCSDKGTEEILVGQLISVVE